jgi:hypothetical protein
MEDLIKAAQALLTYIEGGYVYDQADDGGDGQVNHSQSYKLRNLVHDLEYEIKEAIPTRDAMKLIKKCFIESVQTAIARQTEQP